MEFETSWKSWFRGAFSLITTWLYLPTGSRGDVTWPEKVKMGTRYHELPDIARWDKNDKNLVKFFKIFMNFSGAKQPGSRRLRTAYTNTQLIELEKEFYLNKYLCRYFFFCFHAECASDYQTRDDNESVFSHTLPMSRSKLWVELIFGNLRGPARSVGD